MLGSLCEKVACDIHSEYSLIAEHRARLLHSLYGSEHYQTIRL